MFQRCYGKITHDVLPNLRSSIITLDKVMSKLVTNYVSIGDGKIYGLKRKGVSYYIKELDLE